MTNDFKEGRSVPKPTDKKLRIFRADGTEVIFGTSVAIFRPQFQDEKANVGFQPCETTVTKSGHPRAVLNRDNKLFIYVPEKRGMRETIPPLFVISPRSSQFQSISKGVDNNEASGEINVSKAFSQRQPMFGKIKADKSLTKYQLLHIKRAGAEHRVAKRSPLELGLVQGLAVTHHGSAAPASTHHSVVLHPPKPAHAVQVSALHGVAGLVTHAVIDPGLHITSTTVLTHDKPLLAHDEPHPEVVIPVVVKHEVVALAHPAQPLFRAHVGGFGVGLDFGGHGAGHGFYAAASAFAFR